VLFNFRYFGKIYLAFFFLNVILLVGTIGFILVEDYSLADAFYMTIITVSTVGFGEVQELSSEGRLFTSFLIITSFGTFAYAASSITKYLAGGEYREYFRDYRVNQEISKLKDHVIVCGFGRNGNQAIKTLEAYQQNFVVIETDEDIISKMGVSKNVLYLFGDATEDANLVKAGIHKAKALITTLPKDSDNLFVVLSARTLNPKLTIISRASEDNSDAKLRIAGANNVIMPDKVGGAHMASLVMSPDVLEFLDHISVQGAAETNLEEISFQHIPEDFQYKTLRELEARYKTGATIVGFKNAEGEYIINPSPDIEILPHSKLFVLGTPEQIETLNNILGFEAPTIYSQD